MLKNEIRPYLSERQTQHFIKGLGKIYRWQPLLPEDSSLQPINPDFTETLIPHYEGMYAKVDEYVDKYPTFTSEVDLSIVRPMIFVHDGGELIS